MTVHAGWTEFCSTELCDLFQCTWVMCVKAISLVTVVWLHVQAAVLCRLSSAAPCSASPDVTFPDRFHFDWFKKFCRETERWAHEVTTRFCPCTQDGKYQLSVPYKEAVHSCRWKHLCPEAAGGCKDTAGNDWSTLTNSTRWGSHGF